MNPHNISDTNINIHTIYTYNTYLSQVHRM